MILIFSLQVFKSALRTERPIRGVPLLLSVTVFTYVQTKR
jgi:hypothetical protein